MTPDAEEEATRAFADDLNGYIQHRDTEITAAYAMRGRHLKDFTDTELIALWERSFRAWAIEPTDSPTRQMMSDSMAESLLRGLKLPKIPDAEETLRASVAEAIKQLEANPTLIEEWAAGVLQEIDEFKALKDRAKN